MAINFKNLEETGKALKPIHQTGRSFHVTFVFKKNKMITIAHNNYNKEHPYYKFGKYRPIKSRWADYQAGIHSEIAALIKLGTEDCSGYTFVNVRIDNNGNPANSKPCKNCQKVLDQIGYHRLWFLNERNEYELVK